MSNRIQVHEDGRIPAKEARNSKIEGPKRRITRKEHRMLWIEFETGGLMAQKGLWNVARVRMLRDTGALLEEEGDLGREYKAMNADNFPSSWLREDVEGPEKKGRRWTKRPARSK